MPVSSQLVSMPSTRGSPFRCMRPPRIVPLGEEIPPREDRIRPDSSSGRAISSRGVRRAAAHAAHIELHDDRIDVVGLVVARATPDLGESLGAVQRLRDGVVGAHLEEEVARAARRRLGDQRAQQRAPLAAAAGGLGDARSSGCRHPSPRAEHAGRRSRRCGRRSRARCSARAGSASSSRIMAVDQASVGNEAFSIAMIGSRSAGVAGRMLMRPPASARARSSRRGRAGRGVRMSAGSCRRDRPGGEQTRARPDRSRSRRAGTPPRA